VGLPAGVLAFGGVALFAGNLVGVLYKHSPRSLGIGWPGERVETPDGE